MRVHAVETGRVRVKASQLSAAAAAWRAASRRSLDDEWSGWLPTYAFAVEHPEGVILVDTGANAGLKRLPRWHPYFQRAVKFDIEPEQEAGAQLRAMGVASERRPADRPHPSPYRPRRRPRRVSARTRPGQPRRTRRRGGSQGANQRLSAAALAVAIRS